MKNKCQTFSGTRNPAPSERECENRKIARKAAAQSVVLLKNEGVLPLKKESRVALFGAGACHMIKGGKGSGEVNEREVVSIAEGLSNAGVEITSRAWLDEYILLYNTARRVWRDRLREELAGREDFDIYSRNPFELPQGREITTEDFGNATIGIYVISRSSGEGMDRALKRGDYEVSEYELRTLQTMASCCDNLVVVLNVGGQINLKEILAIHEVKGLVLLGQPGMEGGNALADVLTGVVNPCGKLAATWAENYSDFPNADTFSFRSGDVSKELYVEGIYVGYRYFDSFGVKPAFPFGFGLSYTSFEITPIALSVNGNTVNTQIHIRNTGKYSGREVVQVYVYCPQKTMPKELRRLCGFVKTSELKPGEEQKVTICFHAKDIASFDKKQSAWILESGQYGVFVGNASNSLSVAGVLEVSKQELVEEVDHICPLQEPLQEIVRPNSFACDLEMSWRKETEHFSPLCFKATKQNHCFQNTDRYDEAAKLLADQLSDEELIAIVAGDQETENGIALGAAGRKVPGAAGETTASLESKWGIPAIELADGPAGLRLWSSYEVDRATKTIYDKGMWGALEGGILCDDENHDNADIYYQYCTAMPVGSTLAQSWDISILEEVGRAVGTELKEFGIALWLAPGMNIQRNPLCGRNFEYFSEDPLLSGVMSAAITRGVQSRAGVGTTIKHFACNNQEDNRMGSNSVVSERALREIYLRGFEIAVKESLPMAIMTSFNLVNGIHTANSYDLCTTVVRNEWGFQGLIMTDWSTTSVGGSEPWMCINAGNDLIMPGVETDAVNIREALNSGLLDRSDLKKCACNILRVILQTIECDGSKVQGESE